MADGTAIVRRGARRRLLIDPNARWGDQFIIPIVPQQEPQGPRRFEAEIRATPVISTAMATAWAANRRF